MATVTKYHLTITQTRPDTDTRWYDKETNDEWKSSWKAFNFYDVETTIDQGLLEGQEPYTTMIAHAKITAIWPEGLNSNQELIKTRKYLYISEDVYNEFMALLNDDTSGLSAERRYDEAHGITYELTTEEEVQEIEATP
jgi:hypothetical protein